MLSFINKNKSKIVIISIYIFIAIIFYSYNITLTWDSTEYLGLADILGTKSMKDGWIGHRGLCFPLLIKIGTTFGIKNLMFIFYSITFFVLYKFYTKLKETNSLNILTTIGYILYCLIFLLLHSILFAYFHTMLTEFVAITFLAITTYLSWKFIDCLWELEPKKFYLYSIIFALLVCFIYNVKQSLTPMILMPILVANFFSILSVFNIKNIISRIISLAFIILVVLSSLFIWKSIIGNKVLKDTYDLRIAPIDRSAHLYTNDSTNNNNDDDNDNIINNYIRGYIKTIIVDEKFPFWAYKENLTIGSKIYQTNQNNIVDYNPEYYSYIEPYSSINKENIVSNLFNMYIKYTYIFMMYFTKITLLATPILLIILCIIYLFVMKKLPVNILSIYQLAIMLYATTFFGIFAYVIFSSTIDRYTVPLMFTGILGNYILILLLINIKTILFKKAVH